MAFVADDETPELVDPGEGALDDRSLFSQVLAAFDAAQGEMRCDVTSAKIPAAAAKVVAFVGVQFGGPFAEPPAWLANGLDRVNDVAAGGWRKSQLSHDMEKKVAGKERRDMSERQMDEAIRITEERLEALKSAVERGRSPPKEHAHR